MRRLVSLAFVLSCFFSVQTNAADYQLAASDASDGVSHTVVSLTGPINPGDAVKFRAFTREMRGTVTILMSSPGGSLMDGIEIGRIIKAQGYLTAAADMCASACALAWLAGETRFLSDTSRVGFHVAYVNGAVKRETGMGNAVVGHYIGELGFNQNVVEYVTTAAPDDMQWLTPRDASLLGIKVDTLDSGKISPSPTDTSTFSPSPVAPTSETRGTPQTEPVISSAEEKALRLIVSLFSADMTRKGDALTLVRNSYADQLRYYGKVRSFAQVYQDKQKYFERWPIRRYGIRPSSVAVKCDVRFCTVEGLYDWAVSNKSKNTSGAASFRYVLEQVAGEMRVISEDGQVLR